MSCLRETPLSLWLREERRKKDDLYEPQRPNRYRLAKLSMSDSLPEWERNFVATLIKARKLSRKEQRFFDALWANHGRPA
jgi:hypothetical protein